MRVCLILLLMFLSGCGRTSFYAPLGATVGGAVGSLGGPVGSGGGALVGWGVGKGAALVETNKDLVQTVDALSRGDVYLHPYTDTGNPRHQRMESTTRMRLFYNNSCAFKYLSG